MKKVVLIGVIGLGLVAVSAVAFAISEGCEKKTEVPAVVKTAFEKQYPGLKAEWSEEDGCFEAEFKQNKKEMSAVYDAQGVLQETEEEITVNELPKAVTDYVNANKSGKIKEAAIITKPDGTVNYEAEIKGKDFMFDATGNFIQIASEGQKVEK
ncbi:MAG: PepSY-like domain-containing protein [Bacteroidales bacterium]|nr:PepSY-like domain-containing protein [Bacteroidales bacterium]MDD4821862.1 PepSY-like domain-containing protein [Bacteroidales bacterium]